MASHFLDGLVQGEPGFSPKPWYNRHGDCIIFKAADVGVVAERIDDTLHPRRTIAGLPRQGLG